MKLTIILITAAIVNVSAKGLSQTVSFSGKNTPLTEVLTAVEKQTGFAIVYIYHGGLLNKANPVSLSVTNVPLENFLQQVFKNQPLDYSIKSTTIFISRKAETVSTVNLKPASDILAPPGSVKGRVTNENGELLAGTSITLKGMDIAGTTDDNGYYKIDNITAGKYTLIVSYIGYATKTAIVEVNENTVTAIDFKLEPSLVNLDQITVAGTLSARKIRAYPATIAVIEQKDLKNRNLNNIANALGAVPGIIIQPESEMYNSGNIRRPNAILIRGAGTYGLGNTVKYLIDGVQIIAENSGISILQTLDPNSIEKIEVLKGPMASTLYGSGAAGGIISITTKKGASGKTHFNLKTMFTGYANDYADYKGFNQNYSANISGGSEQFNYLMGVGYNLYPTTKLTDINNGIDTKTWSHNVRIGGKIKNVAADLSLQYGNEKSGNSSSMPSYNKYRASFGLSPLTVYPLENSRNLQRSFLTTLHLTHTIATNWYHDLTVGYNLVNYNTVSHTPNMFDSTYANYESLFSKITARYFMFYEHTWSEALKTNITAGFEYNGYETHTLNFNSTAPLTNFFTGYTAALENAASFIKSPYSSTGYFAEAVSSLNDNLFLTMGIRYDVDPAYGDNIAGYAQPRVGLSYIIERDLFKIKPRIVWGVSSVPPGPTMKTTTITNTPYSTFIQVGNPNIKPQRNEGYEFGADIFYGSNYSLNITYYNQEMKDKINAYSTFDFNTNPLTIYLNYLNIAETIDRGLEVSAKTVFDPFVIDISYTQTTSKWGKTGLPSDATLYPGAPNIDVPKRSIFARLSYKIPSVLPWTKKGGGVSVDWRFNGSALNLDDINYILATDAWTNAPDPKPDYPNQNNYLKWQKGYSIFNLRADYSITNYAAVYIDIQNLLDKQGSINGQSLIQFQGRRINFGFNLIF